MVQAGRLSPRRKLPEKVFAGGTEPFVARNLLGHGLDHSLKVAGHPGVAQDFVQRMHDEVDDKQQSARAWQCAEGLVFNPKPKLFERRFRTRRSETAGGMVV